MLATMKGQVMELMLASLMVLMKAYPLEYYLAQM